MITEAMLTVARKTKGFMPDDEGMALHEAALHAGGLGIGPLLEVGTYCGKSAVYLGAAAYFLVLRFFFWGGAGSPPSEAGCTFTVPAARVAMLAKVSGVMTSQ